MKLKIVAGLIALFMFADVAGLATAQDGWELSSLRHWQFWWLVSSSSGGAVSIW